MESEIQPLSPEEEELDLDFWDDYCDALSRGDAPDPRDYLRVLPTGSRAVFVDMLYFLNLAQQCTEWGIEVSVSREE